MAFGFVEKVYDGDRPGVESTLRENSSLEWYDAGDKVRTDESLEDDGTSSRTKNDRYPVGAVKQIFWKNSTDTQE